MSKIQAKLDVDTDAWVPSGSPSPPTRPISYWVKEVNQVRKESKRVLDFFLAKGQVIGTGSAPFNPEN